MIGWKKYKLLSEDEYERMKIKELRVYNPQLKSQVRSQIEIDKVLVDPKMTPDEKIRMIQTIRQRVLKPDDTPTPIPPVAAVPEVVTEAPAAEVPKEVSAEEVLRSEDISEFVPKQFMARAKLLSKHLAQHPNILTMMITYDNLMITYN